MFRRLKSWYSLMSGCGRENQASQSDWESWRHYANVVRLLVTFLGHLEEAGYLTTGITVSFFSTWHPRNDKFELEAYMWQVQWTETGMHALLRFGLYHCHSMLAFPLRSCVSFSAAGNPMALAIGILFLLAQRSGILIFPYLKCHRSQSYYGKYLFSLMYLLQSYVKHSSLCPKNVNLRWTQSLKRNFATFIFIKGNNSYLIARSCWRMVLVKYNLQVIQTDNNLNYDALEKLRKIQLISQPSQAMNKWYHWLEIEGGNSLKHNALSLVLLRTPLFLHSFNSVV